MTAEQEIRELNKAYCLASLKSDVDWYARHLADEFVCISFDAVTYDKPGFLKMIGKGTDQVTYDLPHVDIRVYGDTALVRAVGAWTTRTGTRGESHYTDVYVRSAGTWKCVSAQITRPSR